MAAVSPTRPALRWHGGKWRLAPWIISHFPAHRVYVEPFGGGGSVLLRKPRAHAEVYNDLDGEVVNLFRVLRDRRQAAELQRLLKLTPFARAEMQAAYEAPPPSVSNSGTRAAAGGAQRDELWGHRQMQWRQEPGLSDEAGPLHMAGN